MITITASGFIAKKPELQLVGAKRTPKCEFDVVDSRREWRDGQWETVWERATFVAWSEEAEKVAERLDKGYVVTCTGLQETSIWTDSSQTKRKTVKYKLTAWESKPPSVRPPEGGDADNRQRGNSQQQGHRDSEHGYGEGENPQGHHHHR